MYRHWILWQADAGLSIDESINIVTYSKGYITPWYEQITRVEINERVY